MMPAEVATAGQVRASDEPSYRQLVARAAARYRPAGRHAYYFVRGKLGGDPVFAALLRDGRFAAGTRIVDIGCGVGVLPALLAEAESADTSSVSAWPLGWMPPPRRWTLHGIDLRNEAVDIAHQALADLQPRVSVSRSDARTSALPACDVVALLDVLHYMDGEAQQTLLSRIYAALSTGGTLLARVADAGPGWRFRVTLMLDWLVSFGRTRRWPHLHCRPLREWIWLLEAHGFAVTAQSMSEGTPFANVLLIAVKTARQQR